MKKIIALDSIAFFRIKDILLINSDIPTWSLGASTYSSETLAKPVLARVSEMPENYHVETHQHPWGQLAYASAGIMKVSTLSASFIIPPERALWIPKFTPHTVSTRFGLSFRSLYIDNEWSKNLPEQTTPININRLLRELILRVTQWNESLPIDSTKNNLLKVLLNEIECAHKEPLFLHMPTDKRLIKITARLNNNPADNTTLEEWSHTIGATPRTLNRLFQKETQMGFVEWRQRLRILFSLERIEQGENINRIAGELGYDSGSAFITMFKKHLGQSPKQYLKETQDNFKNSVISSSIESST